LVRVALAPQRAQDRGRVRRPAAEPGGDGDALLETHVSGLAKCGQCAGHERVVGKSLDGGLVGLGQLQLVEAVDRLEERRQPVVAVLPQRPDPQAQVHLCRCAQDHPRSSSASCPNRSGGSCSARRSAISAGGAGRPARRSEFASVLRRWANAPCTTVPIQAQSGPKRKPGRRRNATSIESTLGWGTNTVRDTGRAPVRSQASWTSTDTAPYALVPGTAKSRSPISRCTITQNRST